MTTLIEVVVLFFCSTLDTAGPAGAILPRVGKLGGLGVTVVNVLDNKWYNLYEWSWMSKVYERIKLTNHQYNSTNIQNILRLLIAMLPIKTYERTWERRIRHFYLVKALDHTKLELPSRLTIVFAGSLDIDIIEILWDVLYIKFKDILKLMNFIV
jgi:hypothetical protein